YLPVPYTTLFRSQISDALLDFERLLQHIETCDRSRTGRGRQKTRQHAHGGCLAGTVRSEKADDLAFLNLKRDVVDSKIARVLLGNFLNSDHISLSRALRGTTLNRSLVESSK